MLAGDELEEAVLGKRIDIPAFIGDDFPKGEWLKFEAFIYLHADGTLNVHGQQATRY